MSSKRHSVDRGPGQPGIDRACVRLQLQEVLYLGQMVTRVAGAAAAAEMLFQVGRAWGEREAIELARQAPPRLDPRLLLERGVARATELGLGEVQLQCLELDAERKHCRLAGRLRVSCADGNDPGERPAQATQADSLAAGFLTGMSARLSGLDLVCVLPGDRPSMEGSFDVRTAHAQGNPGSPEPSSAAPVGSARFFLGSMGQALAAEDIALDDWLENSGDAQILIDSSDVIRFWNRAAVSMFGYSREEVVGRRVGFLVPADLKKSDELGAIRQRLESDGSIQNWITRRVTKDGRELWVSLTRTLLHDRRGKVVGSTASIRDITAQRRTEEELQRSRGLALLGELSAKMAHEIKNPLAGIYAAVQLLAREAPPDDPRRSVFEDLGGEIRRLNEIVQELLSFARPLPTKPAPTDLRSFVLDLLASLRLQPDLGSHQLQVSIREGLIVEFDARLMGQALANLVLNAAQAMQEPGLISIVAVESPESIVVDVSDTGPGFPREHAPHLFEPFFTTKTRGSGLGLAIARKNVEAHGGTLGLEQQEGPGARFRITLPRQARAGGGAKHPDDPVMQHSPER